MSDLSVPLASSMPAVPEDTIVSAVSSIHEFLAFKPG